MMVKRPNFFIAGAPKCGTTSLAAWLVEHPNIYMSPIKEPFYFSSDIGNQWIHTWKAYNRLFDGVCPEHLAVGEASPAYLFSRVAVPAIEEQLPGARYIVMLRNPVEMAYAFHDQLIRSGHENIHEFQQAWYLSPERRAGRQVLPRCKDPILLDYQSWCLLGEQLERLYSRVPRERVLTLVLDDVRENPRQEYLKALGFLGVLDDARQHFPVHNPAREWRSPHLGRIVRSLAQGVGWVKYIAGVLPTRSLGLMRLLEKATSQPRQRAPLSPEFRAELEHFFERDLCRLESLLGREFPNWRKTTAQES